jgi:RNA polymerase-binding transcription factor DksA
MLIAHDCSAGTVAWRARHDVTVEDVRRRLDAERRRALELLHELRGDFASVVDASRDSNADDEHDPEGATIAFERQQVDALIRRSLERIDEVGEALRRVDVGTYGVCARCARPIDPARLEARPTARSCVHCA